MKLLITLFAALNLLSSTAQEFKGYELDSIFILDSLFRDINSTQYQWIKFEGDDLYISHSTYVFDSTKQTQSTCLQVIDTVSISCIEDPTTLDNFTEKHGIEKETFVRLTKLIRDNTIIAIKPAGPGDCNWCSVYFFTKKSQAFVILDKNGYCYSENCYWSSRKERSRKVKENVYFVRNIKFIQ